MYGCHVCKTPPKQPKILLIAKPDKMHTAIGVNAKILQTVIFSIGLWSNQSYSKLLQTNFSLMLSLSLSLSP